MQDIKDSLTSDIKNVDDAMGRLNWVIGVIVIGLGVLNFITSGITSVSGWLYTAYFFLFGIMILSAHQKFDIIDKHFVFLKKPTARGLFNIYVGTLCFKFADNPILLVVAWVGFSFLALIGLYYIYKGWTGSKPAKDTGMDATIATIRGI